MQNNNEKIYIINKAILKNLQFSIYVNNIGNTK